MLCTAFFGGTIEAGEIKPMIAATYPLPDLRTAQDTARNYFDDPSYLGRRAPRLPEKADANKDAYRAIAHA